MGLTCCLNTEQEEGQARGTPGPGALVGHAMGRVIGGRDVVQAPAPHESYACFWGGSSACTEDGKRQDSTTSAADMRSNAIEIHTASKSVHSPGVALMWTPKPSLQHSKHACTVLSSRTSYQLAVSGRLAEMHALTDSCLRRSPGPRQHAHLARLKWGDTVRRVCLTMLLGRTTPATRK